MGLAAKHEKEITKYMKMALLPIQTHVTSATTTAKAGRWQVSDTPRTDAEVFDHEDYDSHPTMVLTARVVPADFARGLERELAEARKALKEAMEWCKPCNYDTPTWKRWESALRKQETMETENVQRQTKA